MAEDFECSGRKPKMQVWADSATRCRLSATDFTDAFSAQ